ncbi:hypothetical protein ACLOJK_026294 [Asimina triloba]
MLLLGFGLWHGKKRWRGDAVVASIAGEYSRVKRLWAHRFIKVSLFEKPKIKLADLIANTLQDEVLGLVGPFCPFIINLTLKSGNN